MTKPELSFEESLGEALQDVWNDHCADTGCVPTCFEMSNPRTKLAAHLSGSSFVAEVVKLLTARGVKPPDPAHVIGGERLSNLISICHRKMRHKYQRTPLWAMVGDITGHGSTVSMEICIQAGFDPHQNCGVANLKQIEPKEKGQA